MLASTDLVWMRDTQQAAMLDTCQVGTYSVDSSDVYGNPVAVYTYGASLACGLEQISPKELLPSAQVPSIDARIRLPVDTAITSKDRIKITHRHGQALAAAQVYDVAGPPRQGPSGLVVDLRLATNA